MVIDHKVYNICVIGDHKFFDSLVVHTIRVTNWTSPTGEYFLQYKYTVWGKDWQCPNSIVAHPTTRFMFYEV